MKQVLKGLSRQQRKKLAEELIRTNHPGISNGELNALVRTGVYPKRFTPLRINQAIRNQLKDAVGASASSGGSAASGIVREGVNLVFGIASSVETYR